MAIILQEALRALFYAPFYVALARDAFAAEGVEIRFTSSPHPDETARRVMDGTVDVCWGGPMRVMETYHSCRAATGLLRRGGDARSVPADRPRAEARLHPGRPESVQARDGERGADAVALPAAGLRRAGIDPAGIMRVTDRTMAENMAALKAGTVDVIQVFEPFPSLLLAEGAAHIWYEAARRGPTSYTSFYARRGTLAIAARRAAAHGAGDRPHREVGREGRRRRDRRRDRGLLRRCAAAILAAACTRYKTLGIWATTPVLPRAGYDRLRDGLVPAASCRPARRSRRRRQHTRRGRDRARAACARVIASGAHPGRVLMTDMQRRPRKTGCVALGKLPHSHSD